MHWKTLALVVLVILFFVLTKPGFEFNFGNSSSRVVSVSWPKAALIRLPVVRSSSRLSVASRVYYA